MSAGILSRSSNGRIPIVLASILLASLLLMALSVQPKEIHAQDREISPSDTVLVVLVDGTELTGIVVETTEEEIVLRTLLEVVMTIPRDSIASIESLSGRKYRRRDPNVSRLLFAPTGRALGNGIGYFADYYLFFPFVAVGVGNNVNLAGGISLIPAADGQLVYFAPKVTFVESDGASVAGGFIISKFLGGDNDAPSLGMVYGVGTLGSSEAALTVGLGLGFVDGEFADSPALLIGGELQMSNSAKLITENYIMFGENDFQLLSGGVRFFGRKLAVDIAMITTIEFLKDNDGFPFFPFVGFAYNFGQ